MSYEWIDSCIRHFCNSDKLLVLNVFNDKRLIGIAPLIIRRYKNYGFPMRSVCFIGTEMSDRMDFIIDGDRENVVALIMGYLVKMRKDWDAIDLREISEDTGTMKIVKEWVEKKKIKTILGTPKKSFFIGFNENRELLLQKFSKRFKKKFRYINNKLTNLKLDFEGCVENNGRKDKLFSDMCLIEEKSWKGRAGLGIFSKEVKRNFHMEIFERFSRNKWVNVSILILNEKPIAYTYNYLYCQTLYSYNHAFDETYSDISPGTMLMLWTLKDFTSRDISEFDFVKGEESYKARFTNSFRMHHQIRIFNNRFYPKFLYYLQKKLIPYMKKNKVFRRVCIKVKEILKCN